MGRGKSRRSHLGNNISHLSEMANRSLMRVVQVILTICHPQSSLRVSSNTRQNLMLLLPSSYIRSTTRSAAALLYMHASTVYLYIIHFLPSSVPSYLWAKKVTRIAKLVEQFWRGGLAWHPKNLLANIFMSCLLSLACHSELCSEYDFANTDVFLVRVCQS